MCPSFWKMKHKFDILKKTKESTTKRRFINGTILMVLISITTMYCNIKYHQYDYTRNNSHTQHQGQKTELYTDTSEHKTLKPSIFEYRHVADIVQKRLELIQNPKDCNNAKRVICEIPSKGFGYQVHLLTICFTVGYFTNRTVMISTEVSKHSNTAWGEMLLPLSNTCTSPTNQTAAKVVFSVFGTDDIQVIKASFQTNYFDLQRTIPSYLTNVIDHFHSNPSLWWAGQIASFILRPNKHFYLLIEKSKAELGFQNVTVGLLVQIKNKQTQAIYCNIKEYIKLVEKWYMAYERESGLSGIQRRIYIATDEPSVVEKAKQLYSNYSFLYKPGENQSHAQFPLLARTILDTYLLSMCDYLICNMSSDECRLAFELMQPRHIDGSKLAKSLDCPYFIDSLYHRNCKLPLWRTKSFENFIHSIF